MRKFLTLMIALVCSVGMWADDWFINGDATPMGWTDNGDKHRVTAFIPQGNGTYVWIGKLVVGDEGFKIGSNFSGWGDYHPSSSGLQIDIAETDNITEGGYDWKWKVSADGIYKLTLTEGNPNTLKCEAYTPSITQDGEGYYQLGSAADLFEFAELVSHKGIPADAKAKLTNDIDYTAYPRSTIGRHKDIAWAGTFDGQGHKVTIDLQDWMGRTGLFSYVYHPAIKNLWVDGTITMTSRNCAGGLGGRSDGDGTRIDGVLSTVTIKDTQSGDGTYGGLFANVENNNVVISNCAFMGSIDAPSREGNGGLVGWCGSGANITFQNCLIAPASISWNGGAIVGRNTPTVTNCYYYNISNKGNFNWAEGSTLETTTEEKLANGEACYLLNENVGGAEHWYQTLKTDKTPFPIAIGHLKLYANGTFYCDGVTSKGGDIVLSNEDESVIDPHVFGEDGVCTVCLAAGEEATETDGAYQLTNAGKLLWWSQYVNAGHTDANAVLTTDVDLTGAKYTPIGNTDNIYAGHFDGKGHSVTLALNNPDKDYQGLFGVVTDGVKIEKVIVKGSVTGKSFVGGIVGGTNGGSSNAKKTDIWYCGNEATITAAGANGAGIIGVNMNGSASIILTNCYNTGNITSGKEAGAMSGWLGGGWSSVRNCYNSGTVKNGEDVSKAFGRNSGCYFTNCYYTATSGTDNSTENTSNGTPAQVTDAAVTSGELAYKLGEAFGQTIGTDAYPVLDGAAVSYVGDAGYATMYDETRGYEFNGDVEAYVAVPNKNYPNLILTKIDNVPASTPVILKGTYYNKNKAEATLDPIKQPNELKGTAEETVVEGYMFILAKPEGEEVGFYLANEGTKIPAGKAYLAVDNYPYIDVKAFFFAEDGETAINNVNVNDNVNNAAIFNIAGQKLSKLQKGINIVNGKKVLF